jgi:hypothetical protein
MAHRSAKVTNVAASVRAHLARLADQQRRSLNDLILLYALEGFLRRLAYSSHREQLVLKGGLLLFALRTESNRPTRDVDLLGLHLPVDRVKIANLVRELCAQPLPEDDGLRFDAESVETNTIIEDGDYEGVRARFYGYLDRARTRLAIDFAVGDPIVPGPREFPYPTLLDQRPFTLQTYSLESVIAEKLDALVQRGLLTSRLKDCYDLWTLAREQTLDGATLQQAIQATFTMRSRVFTPELPIILTPAFAEDAQKQQQWAAFLAAKSAGGAPIALAEALEPVIRLLAPIWQALSTEHPFSGIWDNTAATWQDMLSSDSSLALENELSNLTSSE